MLYIGPALRIYNKNHEGKFPKRTCRVCGTVSKEIPYMNYCYMCGLALTKEEDSISIVVDDWEGLDPGLYIIGKDRMTVYSHSYRRLLDIKGSDFMKGFKTSIKFGYIKY